MATASCPAFRWVHCDSHCFSWGHTRPQTAGNALVSFNVLAASRNSPRSMFLMNFGILIPTGQPFIQVGLGQSKQRFASVTACSSFRPRLTSSLRLCERYSASNSFIFTRGMAIRSLGFMALRKLARHSASLLSGSFVASQVIGFSASSLWISSFSMSLKAPMRFSISSKSTWWPSNSGPSTHTKRVLPPTVIRQAPHMPVPSTIMVFKETSVGISYFLVSRQTNFIMMAGPMAKHLFTVSRLITSSTPSVTNPLRPYEPSSVIMITSSELSRISFSRIINSLVRPANTVITRLPAAFKACTMGSIGATPTPPPAHTTVPKFSMWVALPSGPTTSVI